MIKVSVIMPVYNSEKYLRDSIESILMQTYDEFEFIIINDGSTDKSLEIMQNYLQADKRIKIITRENKGLVYSLNEGIKIAKGEYIARMDSDDISMPDRFEKQVQYMNKNSDIDILGTYIEVIGDANSRTKQMLDKCFNVKLEAENNKKDALDRTIIAHPSVMMKRDIFKKLKGYNINFKCAEDYELWLRAVKEGYKISNLDEKLLKYRVHNESKSSIQKDTIHDLQDAKFNFILGNKRIHKCLIWGASNGGKITLEFLEDKYKSIEVVGFIDSFKEGVYLNKKIYKAEAIKNIEFDYIFIATTPGKDQAKKILENMGYKEGLEYCYFL